MGIVTPGFKMMQGTAQINKALPHFIDDSTGLPYAYNDHSRRSLAGCLLLVVCGSMSKADDVKVGHVTSSSVKNDSSQKLTHL